jgi:MFS-type transporter involved in bile tolerance (Atg22 family)
MPDNRSAIGEAMPSATPHEKHKFGHYALANKLSVWLGMGTIVPASTMMHPTFASLIAIIVFAVGIFVLRFVAHCEGRALGDVDRVVTFIHKGNDQ